MNAFLLEAISRGIYLQYFLYRVNGPSSTSTCFPKICSVVSYCKVWEFASLVSRFLIHRGIHGNLTCFNRTIRGLLKFPCKAYITAPICQRLCDRTSTVRPPSRTCALWCGVAELTIDASLVEKWLSMLQTCPLNLFPYSPHPFPPSLLVTHK